uniref:Uncharacterized protein n=1 Tax=Panagrolaimus davidi TaxID=227884 RepID=A0A914PDF0_9BILA
MVSFADIATIINTFFVSKFMFVEAWKPWIFEHQGLHHILWLISGYLIYSQGIFHSAIAINRCWVSFSLTTANSKMGKLGQKMIKVLPILPFTILSVRFWGHTQTVYTPTGDLTSFYVESFIKNVCLFL